MRLAVRELALLFTLLLLPLSARADPVAVLAAPKGKVMLTSARRHAKGAAAATFGTPLERGDRISVGANSSATLFFNDGNIIELGAGSSMTISGRIAAGTAVGPDRLPREAFGPVANFRIVGSRESGLVVAPVMRSGEPANAPDPLFPRSTDVLDPRPTLAWRAVPAASRYVVTLSSGAGEVWKHECQASSLPFPADAQALADGEYLWDVQAFDDSRPLSKATTTFRLVPEVEAHAVRGMVDRMHESAGGANAPGGCYLAGAYLFERGFLADAAEEFTALARLVPDSPAPQQALGDVYRAVGLPDLANAAYRKAKGLSQAR